MKKMTAAFLCAVSLFAGCPAENEDFLDELTTNKSTDESTSSENGGSAADPLDLGTENLERIEIEAYIFSDFTELQDFTANDIVVPSQQDIFDSWGRFHLDGYWENRAAYELDNNDGTPVASELLYWELRGDAPDEYITYTLNGSPVGFVSPDAHTDYIYEATLKSTANDDDAIGFVAAFHREEGKNYIITIQRSNSGSFNYLHDGEPGYLGVTQGWGIHAYNLIEYPVAYNYQVPVFSYEVAFDYDGSRPDWTGKSVRIKAQRSGNVFTFHSTRMEDDADYAFDDEYDPDSMIVLDLDQMSVTSADGVPLGLVIGADGNGNITTPVLDRFKVSDGNGHQFGLYVNSQANTTWSDIQEEYSNAFQSDKVYLVNNDGSSSVYGYDREPDNWDVTGESVGDYFSPGSVITHPGADLESSSDDGETFSVLNDLSVVPGDAFAGE